MDSTDNALIADYLADLPNDSEKRDIRRKMETDPEFAAAVNQQARQIAILRAAKRAEEKVAVRAQYESFRQRQKTVRLRWGIAVAAAIAAVFSMIWILPSSGPEGFDQLAIGHLDPYPLTRERSDGAESPTKKDSAYLYYNQQDFASAISLFKTLNRTANSPKITLYYAESLVQMGDYEEAIPLYKSLQMEGTFRDVAQWRRAICLLLIGEEGQAINLLEEIREGPHYRAKQAEALLNVIKDS